MFRWPTVVWPNLSPEEIDLADFAGTASPVCGCGDQDLNAIGIGTDICDIDRIAEMIRKHGDLFLRRVFTPDEIAYCSRHKSAAQHFAGRWAAKEAVLKALGTGWARGIQWTDLEVCHAAGGKPLIRLNNAANSVAREQGIDEVLISLSHSDTHAVAFAIAVGKTGPGPSAEAVG